MNKEQTFKQSIKDALCASEVAYTNKFSGEELEELTECVLDAIFTTLWEDRNGKASPVQVVKVKHFRGNDASTYYELCLRDGQLVENIDFNLLFDTKRACEDFIMLESETVKASKVLRIQKLEQELEKLKAI